MNIIYHKCCVKMAIFSSFAKFGSSSAINFVSVKKLIVIKLSVFYLFFVLKRSSQCVPVDCISYAIFIVAETNYVSHSFRLLCSVAKSNA